MHIVYDHQIFSWQKYGGISRYFYELSTRMAAFHDCEVTILAPFYVNAYLRDNSSNIIVGKYIPQVPRTGGLMTWLNSKISRVMLQRDPPNIIHETYYEADKLSCRSARKVLTVYDMIYERFGNYFRQTDKTASRKALAVRQADHVICISEHTKRDLLKLLNTEPSKVSVTYLGNWDIQNIGGSMTPAISHPYILYVGKRDRYKNFERFLLAYAGSTRLRKDFRLVCLGGGSFSESELKRIESLGITPGTILQMKGGDEVSVNLYRHAAIFVYPSLYEGFGMPLLEAMSTRCPIACSATSSLPEVAGDAAEYFDPYDGGSIASAIEAVVYSEERKRVLISLGLERVSHFSWEKCVEQTKKVYSALL
jgi:glycosyltransferase involved in cell wall biosynthesis